MDWGEEGRGNACNTYHAIPQIGAPAIYARDLHSAPLRKLERMLACIRNGSFLPDANRSGMLVEEDTSVAHPSRSGYNTNE